MQNNENLEYKTFYIQYTKYNSNWIIFTLEQNTKGMRRMMRKVLSNKKWLEI